MKETWKECSQCNKKKNLNEFYNFKSGKDGKFPICKECERIRASIRYYKNREKRTALMKERYLTHKDEVYKTSKLLKQKYPLKAKARTSVSNAIYTGKLKKGVCYVCSDTKVHGHHNDYSKPLDVIWACPKHHGLLHRKHK